MSVVEIQTSPVASSMSAYRRDARPTSSRQTISWPDEITDSFSLIYLGRQIAAAMDRKLSQQTLTFPLSSSPLIDMDTAEKLFVWRPDGTVGKAIDRWSRDQVVAAIVVNAIRAVVSKWCDAIKSGSVRCSIKSDEATVSISLSFKRKLHPHKLCPNLAR